MLARKRREYHNWIEQHYEVDDADRSEDELAILHQIKIDVPRTAAVVDLFQKPEIQKYGARRGGSSLHSRFQSGLPRGWGGEREGG